MRWPVRLSTRNAGERSIATGRITNGSLIGFLLIDRPRLGERDHARTHPRADFGGRGNRRRRRAPCGPRAKLFLELVRHPSGLVAAFVRNEEQHRVPLLARDRVIDDTVCYTTCTVDQREIAVLERHVARRPFRQEPADAARLARDTDGAARVAFEQARARFFVTLLVIAVACA